MVTPRTPFRNQNPSGLRTRRQGSLPSCSFPQPTPVWRYAGVASISSAGDVGTVLRGLCRIRRHAACVPRQIYSGDLTNVQGTVPFLVNSCEPRPGGDKIWQDGLGVLWSLCTPIKRQQLVFHNEAVRSLLLA